MQPFHTVSGTPTAIYIRAKKDNVGSSTAIGSYQCAARAGTATGTPPHPYATPSGSRTPPARSGRASQPAGASPAAWAGRWAAASCGAERRNRLQVRVAGPSRAHDHQRLPRAADSGVSGQGDPTGQGSAGPHSTRQLSSQSRRKRDGHSVPRRTVTVPGPVPHNKPVRQGV